ncbi:MAG: arginase family protein, partial [Phycisphaerales bacterium]
MLQRGREGELVLTLGGDHSIGVGSVAGALKARPEMGVIWVDAHADINDHKVSLLGRRSFVRKGWRLDRWDHSHVFIMYMHTYR